MAEKQKLQIALYWGAACGGCDVAVLDTDEFLLEIAAGCDIRFWPIAADGKYSDVERMSDGELDLTLFHGAVRNSENEHVAKLLRKKSKLLVAFGSCACMGGIPGLANLTTKEAIFSRVYLNNPSLEGGSHTIPQPVTSVEAGELHLPKFYRRVYRLQDIVEVDYFVPGCPPAPAQVERVLRAVLTSDLPVRGSVVGASARALCDECPRVKGEKKVRQFHRPYEIRQDPYRCLLEQGILCMGSATRGGCGARCPGTGVGCRGCYGPPPGVVDQGAKFLSAVASIVDSNDPQEIDTILAAVYDFVGSAYRFGMPGSLLQRSLRE